MAFSVKGASIIRRADGTNFASPNAQVYGFNIQERTDVTQFHEATYEASTGGLTVEFTIDTIYGFIVQNEDDEIDVTVRWQDSDGNTNDQVLKPLGEMMITEDDATATLLLTADSDGNPGPFVHVLVWGKSVAA